jgi:cell wall-active antibiotic response 4TMS protein YvqF
MKYRYNPSCACARCRAHGFMGPTVLITIGVLFLLSQATGVYWLRFHNTWPALLIVIGLIMFLQHNAPATGHVPREYMMAPPVQSQRQWQPPVPPQPWQQPPAAPQAAEPQQNAGTTDTGEVHNG